IGLDWVHEIDGVPLHTYLDWMASAYLISATGLPAISVPAGFTTAGGSGGSSPRASTAGLPVGLQLVARRRQDWPLLAVAHAFESATGYGRTAPPVLAG
ncbi:MAG TPA: amidase family protein, partial [Streptosporangiaceae bacterium]|nr:amidase family protein [Streptosporangiaceae bacterium]